MKSGIDRVLKRWLGHWVAGVERRPRSVATAILLVTLPLLAYAALGLAVNSDNVRLVSESVPGRQNHEAFAALFPNLENALLVVVDGETAELARDAARDLAAHLGARTDRFTEVYLPAGGEFFERHGMLYRSPEDLDLFGDQLARMQPLIVGLERDPTIANLAGLIEAGLAEARRDGTSQADYRFMLERFGQATVEVYSEFPLAISWEELLFRGSSLDTAKRQVIVAHPVLEFSSLLPAGAALAAIRESAAELGLSAERGVSVRITGNPALNYEEMIGLAWDIAGAGAFCFALVVVILAFALRSVRLVAASVATLIVGLVWTSAFAAAAIGSVNIVSVSFAILFIGLGVDFTIHLGMRYADLVARGRSSSEGLRGAVKSVGASLAVCAVTTAIGFYVFVPTDYLGVAELGLIAGTGMLVIFFLTFTLFPALVSSWLRPKPESFAGASVRFQVAWWTVFERHPAVVRGAALALFCGALFLVPYTRFDVNVVDMRDPETESVQTFDDLLSGATTSPWYLNSVGEDLAEANAIASRMRALDVVERAVTLADYIPTDQEEKLEILADLEFLLEAPAWAETEGAAREVAVETQIQALRDLEAFLTGPAIRRDTTPLGDSMAALRAQLAEFLARVEREGRPEEAIAGLERILLASLPERMADLRAALETEAIARDDLPAELVARMLAPDGRARVQIFPRENLMDEASFSRFTDAVRSIDPRASGVAINLIEFGRATRASFQQALISATLVIGALLFFFWRSVSEMLFAMSPLLLSALLTVAAMVAIGIPFNFCNVVVIPLLLGIGVDSAVHLVDRSQKLADPGESVLATTTARAVFYSALTTIASFGSLAFSSHRGMQSLGILLSLGMTLTVVCNLIVLPSLLALRGPGSLTKAPVRDPAAELQD